MEVLEAIKLILVLFISLALKVVLIPFRIVGFIFEFAKSIFSIVGNTIQFFIEQVEGEFNNMINHGKTNEKYQKSSAKALG